MAQDLPGYLDLVKRTRPDDLLVVTRELDPAYEITALVVKLEREARKRPVVICERVKGTSFPVLTNLHASRSRLALSWARNPSAKRVGSSSRNRLWAPKCRSERCRISIGVRFWQIPNAAGSSCMEANP